MSRFKIKTLTFFAMALLFLPLLIVGKSVYAEDGVSDEDAGVSNTLAFCLNVLGQPSRIDQFKAEVSSNKQLARILTEIQPTKKDEPEIENPSSPKGYALVVGGTNFIGIETVKQLVASGYHVTLLNRDLSGRGAFPLLPLIKADREQIDQLKILADQDKKWDVVVDLSVNHPADVTKLLDNLKGKIKRYVLISSISVYQKYNDGDWDAPFTEDGPLLPYNKKQAESWSNATFGNRKAEAERVAIEEIKKQGAAAPGIVIIRPALVYGKNDPSDRFAYWIWRAVRGKSFLLPNDGKDMLARVYVSDLARAIVTASFSDRALGKAYNIADLEPVNLRDSLAIIGQRFGLDPLKFAVPVSEKQLEDAGEFPPLDIGGKSVIVDMSRAKNDLGYTSTPVKTAILNSVDDFLSREITPISPPDDEAEAGIIAKLKEAGK